MKLLTKAILKTLPPLYSTEKDPDPIIRVKFFNPCGAGTWYATEFDGEDRFFGLCEIHEKELGYFSLSELSSIRLRFGLKIERDMWFKPCPMSKVYPERYPTNKGCGAPPTVCNADCPDCTTIGDDIESLLFGGSHG